MVGQAARLHPTAPGDGFLHTRLLLLPSGDPPGGAAVATVPPGEGPVVDDLGVHNDLDASIKEGHDFKTRNQFSCTPEMYEPHIRAFSPHVSRGQTDQQNSQPVNYNELGRFPKLATSYNDSYNIAQSRLSANSTLREKWGT